MYVCVCVCVCVWVYVYVYTYIHIESQAQYSLSNVGGSPIFARGELLSGVKTNKVDLDATPMYVLGTAQEDRPIASMLYALGEAGEAEYNFGTTDEGHYDFPVSSSGPLPRGVAGLGTCTHVTMTSLTPLL